MERLSRSFERAESNELIRKASEKADFVLERDEIELDNFSNLYGQEVIAKDSAYVEMMEKKFQEQRTPESENGIRYGKILEALVHEHGEQSNWFGETASTIRTSRYDDIANRVDEVIEFSEDDNFSFLALAIDATSNENVAYKINKILEEIREGTLAKVKYFEAAKADIRGEISQIPHVVVGADSQSVINLSELWVGGKNSELAKHPIQFQILEQIQRQCSVFSEYAKSIGNDEASSKYDKAHRIIREILDERRKAVQDSGDRDALYHALMWELRMIKKQEPTR